MFNFVSFDGLRVDGIKTVFAVHIYTITFTQTAFLHNIYSLKKEDFSCFSAFLADGWEK